MTIFAGFSAGAYLNDVWVLTNANGFGGTPTWTQLSPTGSTPTTRELQTTVYDTVNNRMMLYGGFNNILSYLSDVWVLSNANGLGGTPTWTQSSTAGNIPQARGGHSAVYDNTNNRMTIFGGRFASTFYLNDVYILSNANGLDGTTSTWTQLIPTGVSPGLRFKHTAVYDTTNNRMIIFAGDNTGTFLNDVWVLSHANGLGGASAWTQLTITGSSPTTRWGHTAIYDNTNNRMIIFGGYNSNGSIYLNDTWVLSNANGLGGTSTWTQITTTGSTPTTRREHTAIYDTTNNRMTIFAGYNAGSYLNDVWVLNGANGVPVNDWMLYSSDINFSSTSRH
jgi:hypothetical protein